MIFLKTFFNVFHPIFIYFLTCLEGTTNEFNFTLLKIIFYQTHLYEFLLIKKGKSKSYFVTTATHLSLRNFLIIGIFFIFNHKSMLKQYIELLWFIQDFLIEISVLSNLLRNIQILIICLLKPTTSILEIFSFYLTLKKVSFILKLSLIVPFLCYCYGTYFIIKYHFIRTKFIIFKNYNKKFL